MKDYDELEISKDTLEKMSHKADELILKGDRLELEEYSKELADKRLSFTDTMDEARFLYIMGNCHQVLYQHREMDWYSDDLSKAAIFFRRALNIIKKLNFSAKKTYF